MGQTVPCATSANAATILVADDSELNRALFRRLLARAGFNVAEARDGCEAIEEIERFTPDLVLLDLRMPGVSGIEVLRQARREFDQARLPIIVVTADTDIEMTAKCLAAGANDYITKPIVWSILRARLETHLSLHRAHAELMMLYQNRALEFREDARAD